MRDVAPATAVAAPSRSSAFQPAMAAPPSAPAAVAAATVVAAPSCSSDVQPATMAPPCAPAAVLLYFRPYRPHVSLAVPSCSSDFQPVTTAPPCAPTAVAAHSREYELEIEIQPATTAPPPSPPSSPPLSLSPRTPPMDQGFVHAGSLESGFTKTSRTGRGCFNCHGSHRARDCQQPLIYGGRGYMRCFNCTGKHPRRLCPYPMRIVYRSFLSDDW